MAALAVGCASQATLLSPPGSLTVPGWLVSPLVPIGVSVLTQLLLVYGLLGLAVAAAAELVLLFARRHHRWAAASAGAAVLVFGHLAILSRVEAARARLVLSALPVLLGAALLLVGLATTRSGRSSAATAGPALLGAVLGLATLAEVVPPAWRTHLEQRLPPHPASLVRPDIVLVVLDTTRVDAVSLDGRPRPATPHLAEIARSSAVFLNAFSPAPWTLPAHASLFTGLLPVQHGVGWRAKRLNDRLPTLAEGLRRLGYRTIALSENPFVSSHTGLGRGFDEFGEIYGLKERALATPLLLSMRWRLLGLGQPREYARTTLELLRWRLAARGSDPRPVFCFVNLTAPHLPNYPRREWPVPGATPELLARIQPVNEIPERFYLPEQSLGERELGVMRGLYEGDVAHVDRELGRLVESLRDQARLDSTVLIVTSDHGENFGDHGLIEHQYCLYDTLLHVPLLIRYPPRLPGGTRVQSMVSVRQLHDTVLELAGAPLETGSLSLLSGKTPAALFAEVDRLPPEEVEGVDAKRFASLVGARFARRLSSVRESGYKLIAAPDGLEELYDVAADPGETRNLAGSQPEVLRRLRDRLAAYEALPRLGGGADEATLDAATREALRALGYVQ